MDLSQYEKKYVRVKDIYGNTFTGPASYGVYEFLMHEYGGEEDGLFIEDFLVYNSQIASVEEIEVHGTAELWTDRLLLRRYCPEDAEPLYRNLGTDPSMYQYSGWNPYATPEMARQTVQRFIDSCQDEHFYSWVMDVDDVLVGTIGAYDYNCGQIEVGFSVRRNWQGRGLATEALRKVLEYLTENEGIPCVTAWCASENTASQRVLEKAGMQLIHTEKDGLAVGERIYDKQIYAYRKEEKHMQIKAVQFRTDGFYSQPLVFGGEEGMDQFDRSVRYRGSLQNYLIDTGDEVILVDTGLPAGTPEEVPDENSLLYTGKDISSYMEAFAALGYKPEQVTTILVTHKHADHTGELRSFPNAKIYVNEDEVSADELQGLTNIVPVKFTDGAYYNFPESQKIREGITYIKAKGHTNGNSIVIVENDGLFYMIHGDVTYVDEALYENKLSAVFEDLPAARETLDRVREFIWNHPTVYCGTHTPQSCENLEAKQVMDLDHPVPTIPAKVDFSQQQASGKYVCSVCGYVYDPAEHDGTAFEDLPDDWKCPRCRQPKEKFNKA